MSIENTPDYPCNNMDHKMMNRVLRHRLRNLCAGVKMTIERIASTTASTNPQIGSRCDIVIAELDNLRDFTDRMDLLFDVLPTPEQKNLFSIVTDLRMKFLQTYPFCNFELKGAELNITFEHGSWLQAVVDELLQNAGEAAGDNGDVVLAWEQHENFFSFSVSNTGAGIPKEIPTDPPVPFYTEKSRHDGLGLAIAYRIAAFLGTELKIDSNESNTTIELKISDAEIVNG